MQQSNSQPPRVDVAVAVVFNNLGQVLWGSRPAGKPYAGYWEFPGGKIERGETVWQGLVRELKEELGITALAGGPWFVIEHDYEHARVRLHLYRVWAFSGEPQALEGQTWSWDSLQPEQLRPILPATEPLLPKLAQPELLVLSSVGERGLASFTSLLEQAPPVKLIVREFDLPVADCLMACKHLFEWGRQRQRRVLLNSATLLNLLDAGVSVNELLNVCGVERLPLHLTETHLMEPLPDALQRISAVWQAQGASVHSPFALEKAFELNLDYALMGAVKATKSHPGEPSLGWGVFADQVALAKLPVYAIGGLRPSDLADAKAHGAHGVAMISGLIDYKA